MNPGSHHGRRVFRRRTALARAARPGWAASAGVGCIAVCLAGFDGAAQAEYRGRQFDIERPQLGIDLGFRSDAETRRGPFGGLSNRERVVSEGFELGSGGWLYHPAVATYTLALKPQWQQSADRPAEGPGTRSIDFFLGYDMGLTLLPYRAYTLDLTARQQRLVLTTSVAGLSESVSTTLGATLKLKYRLLPTTLSLTHGKADQTGFYDTRENRNDLLLTTRHERKDNATQFNLSASALTRTELALTQHTRNVFGLLRNRLGLSAGNRVQLNSNLSYRRSSIDLRPTSGVRLTESLDWRHTPRLSSNYSANLSSDSFHGLSTQRVAVGAALSHSLYENLVTTASTSVSTSSAGEKFYGGRVNFNYQRRIPGGTIYASLGNDYRVTRRASGGTLQAVTDESHVLDDATVTLLANRFVDPATVVVTSADRSVVYAVGVDYTLALVGSTLRISRSSFGAIAQGQTVRVNYTWQASPAFDDATRSGSYGLGFHLWSIWRINYRYTNSKQDFLAGTRPDVMADLAGHTLESDLSWKSSTTRVVYEDTQSTTGVALNRWRVEQSLRYTPVPTAFVGASGYVGRTRLKDLGTTDRLRGLRADLQWLLSGSSKVRFEAAYGAIEGGSINIVEKGASAFWEWSYGVWRADASLRYLNQTDRLSGQSRDRQAVYLTLRRSLN